MGQYAEKLKVWIQENNIQAEYTQYDDCVRSVAEAVSVSGYPVESFTKSIVMLAQDEQIVIAVVPADCRASTERVRKALQHEHRPRVVTAQESEQYLAQKLGGNTPLNVDSAIIFIDPKVLEKDWVLTGGGDDRALIKISTNELKRVVDYTEARVRK